MNKHLPNAFTVLRIALVPVFAAALWNDFNRWVCLAIFLIAGITDLIDGWLARRGGFESDFGAIADPIADKALTGAAWIGLTMFGPIPGFATFLILVREIGITVLRLRLLNRVVIAADKLGKRKTTYQMVTISLLLITPTMHGYIGLALTLLLWYTVWLTTISGWRYLRVIRRALAHE